MAAALRTLPVFAAALAMAPVALGQLTLAPPFVSGAVLQRDVPIPVAGRAAAGSVVTVTFSGSPVSDTTGTDGRWRVDLPARGAGGPYAMTVTDGTQAASLTSIYVGDVFLLAGQSNIEWTLSLADGGPAAAAASNDPLLRQFKVPKGLANAPSEDLPAGAWWTGATPSNAGAFSAVGFYFGRALRQVRPDVPVGLLNVTYGGSRVEAWMTDAMLGFDEAVRLANGEPERQPTVLYNRMIHPLVGVPVKAFVWYQGESNADNLTDASGYGGLFRTMIAGWRGLWGHGDVPFVWVQLPNYGTPQTAAQGAPPTYDAWPVLRAGQSSALALPNTAEVVTIETGNAGSNGQVDIHPTNKLPVGERVALALRRLAYGEAVVASGPRFRSAMRRPDGAVAVRFDEVGGGLRNADGTLNGFTVAGASGAFVWAAARIEGDAVVVSSPSVPEPARVRYAWQYNPGGASTPSAADLTNAEGLPAAPFSAEVAPAFGVTQFTASAPTIARGGSSTLTWTTAGASAVTLDGAQVATSGSLVVTPTATTTYTLRATSADDPARADTARVTIVVGATTRYEAEAAALTGGGDAYGHVPQRTSPASSGGAYLDLREAWTVTFPAYTAPAAGDYVVGVRYLLNYESPKTQNLVVNGVALPVEFTAPDATTWRTRTLTVPMQAGPNTLVLAGSWNYMSIDYLEVVVPTAAGAEPGPGGTTLDVPAPNPVRGAAALGYRVPSAGPVRLDVFDALGRHVATLVDGVVAAGAHAATFDARGLGGGVYVVRLQVAGAVVTRPVVVAP